MGIDDACQANECTCDGGTEAVGAACKSSGATMCIKCNAGWTKIDDACQANECRCPGGTAAAGADCNSSGAAICSECNAGYSQIGSACEANTCTCPNGTPTIATGTTAKKYCEKNGNQDCSACNNGYTSSARFGAGAQTCEANNCTCPNGTPTLAAAKKEKYMCEEDGNPDCSACN